MKTLLLGILVVMCVQPVLAATFTIYDCNQQGTMSSQPFGQTSVCRVGPHMADTVNTTAYVSYSVFSSGLSLMQQNTFGGTSFDVVIIVEDTWTVGGAPPGTPVQLVLGVIWDGEYNIAIDPMHPGYHAEVLTQQIISLDGIFVINASAPIIAVSPGASGTFQYLQLGSYLSTSGANLRFEWEFVNSESTSAAPEDLSDELLPPLGPFVPMGEQSPPGNIQLLITANDPTTGKPIPGVTITGSDGHRYPVNAPCSECSQ